MGLFKKKRTVNDAINVVRSDKSAYLIDVRPKEKFNKGYIAGSINIPYNALHIIEGRIKDKNAPIFVTGSYEGGAMPSKAAKAIKKMGYTNVEAVGFMEDHHGILKTR